MEISIVESWDNAYMTFSCNYSSTLFHIFGNPGLCRLRCFPPVALAWDEISGLHIFPNLQSETILVDSAPALWSSSAGSEKTTVLLLV